MQNVENRSTIAHKKFVIAFFNLNYIYTYKRHCTTLKFFIMD